jgi:hypothetical protein
MSIDELIADAGWFKGDERDWKALPLAERENLAFAATGCAVAYATWPSPVNCVHPWCRVRRGEIKPISILNSQMQYEALTGWWRDISQNTQSGRKKLAAIYRAYRKAAIERKVYDIWKLGGAQTALIGMMG